MKIILTLLISIILLLNSSFSFSQSVEVPEIDYLTVSQLTGNPILSWKVNDPTILDGYIIKRYIYSCVNYNPNWHSIATIHSSNQFTFEDNTSQCVAKPNERSEKYIIRAFKINGTDTVYSSISNFHQTIFLETSYDYCKKANHLIWNNYVGWGTKFANYEIYVKNNLGDFIKIGTTLYNDTTFTHINVENNTNYEYFVKTVRNDAIESNSNISSIFTETIIFPNFLKTDSLIVNDKINLYFNIDEDADSQRYILCKSNTLNGNYDSIAGQNQNDLNTLYFADKYVGSRNFYYLKAIDYCGDEILRSNIISNIKLNTKKKNDLEKISILEWDNSLNNEYKILRSNKPNSSFSEINTTYNLSYNDNLKDVFSEQFDNAESNGTFCYQVVSEDNNFVNKSNIECVKFDETVFIANAFNPKSNIEENRIFKPKLAFVEDYELVVYGSFGDIIFQSNNPNFGWDGNLPNGQLAQRASYLYYLSYKNSHGIKKIKKGVVSLVY